MSQSLLSPEFESHSLHFARYEFPLGYFKTQSRLPAAAVREIWMHTNPPCLVLADELIFVSAQFKGELRNGPATMAFRWLSAPMSGCLCVNLF